MNPTWYVPSFYGDVRMQSLEENLVRVSWEKLTAAEKSALRQVAQVAEKKWRPRAPLETVAPATTSSSSLFDGDRGSVLVEAKLRDVRRVFARALGRGRDTVDVVKFSDGQIVEESSSASLVKEVVAGVTVKKPHLGCPEPRLPNAEIRAREVLSVFLTTEQLGDFVNHNAFVSRGAGTGHRYVVTSRHSRGRLAIYRRQLYDADEKRAYCVHDYEVPAAEEMLALHLFLQFPDGERYLRHLD